jgi:hypothetical protein
MNLVLGFVVAVQVIMAVLLGMLAIRNGRNSSAPSYQVASESSRIVELAGGAVAPPKDVELYRGIPLDEHLLGLDKRALEESYHAHLIKLWSVWLSDGARTSTNIKNGLRIAREAYHQAAQEIQTRENKMKQEAERQNK